MKKSITIFFTLLMLNIASYATVKIKSMFCTWTHTVYYYDEFGNYQGSSSYTATYGEDNSSLNCAMARHIAEMMADDKDHPDPNP